MMFRSGQFPKVK